jgi:hypothetical protein
MQGVYMNTFCGELSRKTTARGLLGAMLFAYAPPSAYAQAAGEAVQMWISVKKALSAADGEDYFAKNVKGAAFPPMRGVVLSGKPSCEPKEVLVSIPVPGQPGQPPAEITLKLDRPLKVTERERDAGRSTLFPRWILVKILGPGKLEPGSEIQWEGVPENFTKSPFMLTMDVEMLQLGVKPAPCAAEPTTGSKKK